MGEMTDYNDFEGGRVVGVNEIEKITLMIHEIWIFVYKIIDNSYKFVKWLFSNREFIEFRFTLS